MGLAASGGVLPEQQPDFPDKAFQRAAADIAVKGLISCVYIEAHHTLMGDFIEGIDGLGYHFIIQYHALLAALLKEREQALSRCSKADAPVAGQILRQDRPALPVRVLLQAVTDQDPVAQQHLSGNTRDRPGHPDSQGAVSLSGLNRLQGLVVGDVRQLQGQSRMFGFEAFQEAFRLRQKKGEQAHGQSHLYGVLLPGKTSRAFHHLIKGAHYLLPGSLQVLPRRRQRQLVVPIDKQRDVQLRLHCGKSLPQGLAGDIEFFSGPGIVKSLGRGEKIAQLGDIHRDRLLLADQRQVFLAFIRKE